MKKSTTSRAKQKLTAPLALILCAAILSGCTTVSGQASTAYYAIEHDEVKTLATDEVTDTEDTYEEATESDTTITRVPSEKSESGNHSEESEENETSKATEESEDSEETDLSETTEVDDDPDKEGTIFSAAYANLSISEKISLLKQFFPAGSYWTLTTALMKTKTRANIKPPCTSAPHRAQTSAHIPIIGATPTMA